MLTAVTTATMIVGVLLILFFEAELTILGLVLIAISWLVFLVDAVDVLGKWRRTTGE